MESEFDTRMGTISRSRLPNARMIFSKLVYKLHASVTIPIVVLKPSQTRTYLDPLSVSKNTSRNVVPVKPICLPT